MNHRVATRKIGKDSKHRLAMMRNLAHDLFEHERVKTTLAKGWILKQFADKIVHRAKVDNLHNRREVFKDIRDTEVLKKLFENIGKRYQNRKGGYTRMYHLGTRKGDSGKLCLVELVEEALDGTEAAKKEATPVAAPKA